MKNKRGFAAVILLTFLAMLGCARLTPTGAAPHLETSTSAASSAAPATTTPFAPREVSPAPATSAPTVSPEASLMPATATPTVVPVATAPPTAAPLALGIVQSQTWTDRQGNARANVLVRNPYDFPVAFSVGAHASLLDSAGKLIKGGDLYFLDGISGGGGFLLPGETIAANVCFTCEQALLKEPWDSVKFEFHIKDATGVWKYSTQVAASGVDVSFDGDSPIFWVTGSVKNNGDASLSRISMRVFVFDKEGQLVGAAEASAFDVAAGASASVRGYGLGQKPAGAVEHQVTALGVNY